MNSYNSTNAESFTFGLKAHVKVFKNFNGASELHFEDDNLIVSSGRSIALLSLLPAGHTNSLQYAMVGTGGATAPGGAFLKTPTVDMTSLYSPVTTIPIAKLSQDLSIPEITLLASLDNFVGNGLNINEAGFFSGDGLMFNIKVFPGIDKTSDFSIDFVWSISVVS